MNVATIDKRAKYTYLQNVYILEICEELTVEFCYFESSIYNNNTRAGLQASTAFSHWLPRITCVVVKMASPNGGKF